MGLENKRYIVNADDFGLSNSVNTAIAKAFQRGLISSTSMMANMSGFEQAVQLALDLNLGGKVGTHLNLTEGTPLTENILSQRRFVNDAGRFSFKISRAALRLTNDETNAVHQEWDAQIRRCLDSGIQPSHLDSHHHVHTVLPLLSLTIKLARKYGVPFIRLSRNTVTHQGLAKLLFKTSVNWRLRAKGLAGAHYFGSAVDVALVQQRLSGYIEIMVHPDEFADGLIRDVVTGSSRNLLHETISDLGIGQLMLSFAERAEKKW